MKEADSAVAQGAPMTRAGVKSLGKLRKKKKKASVKESLIIRPILSRARFKEENSQSKRFRVVIIREGMGNLVDGYYYSREAMENGYSIFEGKKIYADHPTKTQETDQPERSVRDILGHFENCAFSIAEEGDERGQIEADVVILPGPEFDWASALMEHAVQYSQKYPDSEFVGLSINASGTAQPMSIADLESSFSIPPGAQPKLDKAKAEGIESVKYVPAVSDAVSCDLVTDAGAGGKVLQLLEMEKKKMKAKEAKEAKESKEAKEAKKESHKEDDGGHADADQDKELILQMMKDLGMGDGAEEGDEAHQESYGECKEALMHAKEMYGDDHEEAMKCASHAMKMAQHIEKKEAAQKEAASASAGASDAEPAGDAKKPAVHTEAGADEDGDGDPEPEGDDQGKDAKKKAPPAPPAKESHKEAAKPTTLREAQLEIVRLQTELSTLKAQNNKIKIEGYLERKLKESKIPNEVTKPFREKLGKMGLKTEKEVDEFVTTLRETYQLARKGVDEDVFGLGFEKTDFQESEGGSKNTLSDCFND